MSLPDPRPFRLDAKTVFAGVVLPGICFIVDYLTGEWITPIAPAALLTLYVLGCGTLVLSATLDPRSGMSGAVAGALAAVSIAACLISLPLTVLAVVAAFFGMGSATRGYQISPIFFALSALGFASLWTAWTYVRRTRVVVAISVRRRGHLRAAGIGIIGAIAICATVHGADRLDRWWVRSQIEQISKSNPDRWPQILSKLSAYPLCGRERCSKFVCDRLYAEFGPVMSGSFYIPPPVPAAQEEILVKFLGGRYPSGAAAAIDLRRILLVAAQGRG